MPNPAQEGQCYLSVIFPLNFVFTFVVSVVFFKAGIKPTIVVGFLIIMDASFFFLPKAFQLGNVPQVVALSASSTMLTALAGIVVLKENKHMTLKIVAAGLATLGVVLVQL